VGDRSELALIGDDRALTYAELGALVERARERWRAHRRPVALVATPSLDTIVDACALFELGVPVVPLHPRLPASERDAIERAIDVELDEPRDVQAIVFTSGTTGAPRGALLERAAFAASARASARNLPWRDDDRWLLCMPLARIGGLSIVMRCLAARRAIVVHPRFDPHAVLASIARDAVTRLSVVPTMLHDLLAIDRDNALARTRAILLGGAPAPRALLVECAARRVPVLTTYGLTEACSQVTTQAPRDPGIVELGCGRPLDGTAIAIARDDGAASAPDEVGLIVVRAPTLMRGYLGAPPIGDAFVTGDLGRIDERGVLHVVGRADDVVISGGENVHPAAVEAALVECTGVRAAIAFGVDDERWGQRVVAVIAASDGFDEQRVADELALRLPPSARPRSACVVDALPAPVDGKLPRRAVARAFAARLRPFPS
jgi:O-succinylbenzoic acid--CoA ligase